MANLKHGGQVYSATPLTNSPSGKPDSSSIQVKQLSKSEILSLRQNKVESYRKLEMLYHSN